MYCLGQGPMFNNMHMGILFIWHIPSKLNTCNKGSIIHYTDFTSKSKFNDQLYGIIERGICVL